MDRKPSLVPYCSSGFEEKLYRNFATTFAQKHMATFLGGEQITPPHHPPKNTPLKFKIDTKNFQTR